MPARRLMRVWAVLPVLAALLMACTAHDPGKITVGVKFDQPGLSVKKPDGTLAGFDVEVARYVAAELGYAPERIAWIEAPSGQREMLLRNGQVDYVVATYSITDSRRQKVDFAGPYLLAGQSLLVRADNTDITGTASLQRHKKLCSVSGSTPAQRIKDRYPGVQLQHVAEFGGDHQEALTQGRRRRLGDANIEILGFAAIDRGQFLNLRIDAAHFGGLAGFQRGDVGFQRCHQPFGQCDQPLHARFVFQLDFAHCRLAWGTSWWPAGAV